MKSWKIPTPEQVSKAVARLAHAEQYRYFFDRLENPEWLTPLAKLGFFARPPQVIANESDGTVQLPPWPSAGYLARMAPYASEKVLELIMKMPDTENGRVHDDLAQALLNMPPEVAARAVPVAKRWIRAPYPVLLPEKLGDLISRLSRMGQVAPALDLAKSLLALRAAPPRRVGESNAEYVLRRKARARFSASDYEQILRKSVPDLVEAAGLTAFELLCDLLARAVRLSHMPRKERDGEDYSYIWHPAIEVDEEHGGEDLTELLVTAVRQAADRLAARDRALVPALVSTLERHRYKIFQRLALHLLRRYPEGHGGLISARLSDRAYFEEHGLRREYQLLAQDQFGNLEQGDRERILGWIEAGPALENFKARREADTGSRPSEEETQQYRKFWQRDRLSPIRDHLPERWRKHYEALVAELGEPEPRGAIPDRGVVWVGPTSPRAAEDLKRMPVDDILELLRTWRPADRFMGPSAAGLGRELAKVVASEPEQFAQHGARFQGLAPVYVSALLDGLRNATGQGRAFAWEPVLGLCSWILEQGQEAPEIEPLADDRDADWRSARVAVLAILQAGLRRRQGGMPYQFRNRVWEIIRDLTEDRDPTPEHEARYIGKNSDPVTLAINTVRGEAMHAVVEYALWLRRHWEGDPEERARLGRGFEEMREVREVLEAHLDPDKDPSVAVRSVYGELFPWFVLLDRQWASVNVGRIFPAADDQRSWWDAAWETYIVACRPYDNVLAVLEAEYRRAIERLGTARSEWRRLGNPDESLAVHLMAFYWSGKIGLHDADGLLTRFLEKASDRLRAHAMQFIGRALGNTEGEVSDEVKARLRGLWESRLDAARRAAPDASYAEELGAFGAWFRSGKFDDGWSLSQLIEALRLGASLQHSGPIVERIAALAGRMPRGAVEALRLIVQADKRGWEIYYWRKHAKVILGAAIQSNDPTIREEAVALVHYLGTRGHLEFRELIPGRSSAGPSPGQ